MKKTLLIIAIGIMLTPSLLFAEKTHIANTYPIIGRSIRALGMGNALLGMKGIDSDTSPLFYNPAAIHDYSGDLKWTTGLLPVPPFEFNYGTINLIRDVFDFKDDVRRATTDSGKIDVFNSFVNKHIGEFHDLALHVPLVGAHNRYFSASLISDDNIGISFRNRAFPNFEIKATSYTGVAVGGAYGFLDDESLEVGAAMKVLYGVTNEQVVTVSDILQNNFDDFKWSNWKRGLGLGFDLGVKYKIPDFNQGWLDILEPTVAVTYQNIGKTRFIAMKKNGGPDALPQSVSAGVGIHPTFGSIETSFLIDIREINIKEDFLMKLNVGAEARFPKRFALKPSVRAGVNQGYPTVGAGLEIWKVTWNIAFFGKELGEVTREKGGYRLASEFIWAF